MKANKLKYFILFVLLSTTTFSTNCLGKDQFELNLKDKSTIVNPSHLDHLYEEINVNEKQMAIIHIYCDYPDYNWVEAKGEGITCIDDVARAVIFYANYYKTTNNKTYLRKARLLTEFVLYMQAENGYFYNFIESDYSINKTYKTSVAEPNWWSWRALWALSETYKLFSRNDAFFSNRIFQSMSKLFSVLKKNLPLKKNIKNIGGFERPAWLPAETGADQSAILVLALVNYLEIKKDLMLFAYLKDLCDGIIRMQEGDKDNFPYSAFMSWENLWHAYGNVQSYALLKAYLTTHEEKYKSAVLNEINNFYPYLINKNYLNYFSIKKDSGKNIIDEQKRFSQIAYGISPMIFATLEAAEITKDKSYSELAGKISLWFFGKNLTGKEIYNLKTGICYDGINNEQELNKNSGAESTIETLLSLSAIEQNKTALSILKRFMEDK